MKTNELVCHFWATLYGLAFGINDLQLTMPCKVQMSKNLRETTHSPLWAARSILLRPNSIIPVAVNWIVVEVCNLQAGVSVDRGLGRCVEIHYKMDEAENKAISASDERSL
jgi:hypothetical protein